MAILGGKNAKMCKYIFFGSKWPQNSFDGLPLPKFAYLEGGERQNFPKLFLAPNDPKSDLRVSHNQNVDI